MKWRRDLLLLLLVAAFVASAQAALQVGDPLPVLPAPPPDRAGLPSVKDRVVLLDFWASWCAPCKASFPELAALHREFGGRGLVIIAVGIDEKPAAHEGFVRRFAPPFFTLHDQGQTLVRAVQVPTMPTSYVFGRDGRLRSIHAGFRGRETADALRREIGALLEERTAP